MEDLKPENSEIEKAAVKSPDEATSDTVQSSDGPASASAVPQLDFIKEQTKERPLNKRKLLRRTFITALMAVVFGIVACATLVVLEPLMNNRLNPPAEPEPVTLPPETREVLPEDLPLDDEDLINNKSDPYQEIQAQEGEPIRYEAEWPEDPVSAYKESYAALRDLCGDIQKGLVTITTFTSDTNWLEGNIENSGQTTGAIVADTTEHFLILARSMPFKDADRISVTFNNGAVSDADIRMTDPITGISILEAPKSGLDAAAIATIDMMELGNSNFSLLKGGPVIAMGNPVGIASSVAYGVITSTGTPIQREDSRFRLITTDIYGSQSASGFLVNLQGELIGVIDQSNNEPDVKNMVSAIGISELRQTIERLSNRRQRAYLGIMTDDVSPQISQDMGIPVGAYITGVSMDSPAMAAGLQSGDVLVEMNGDSVASQQDYIGAMEECRPEDTVDLTIMRGGRDGYREFKIEVTLAELS